MQVFIRPVYSIGKKIHGLDSPNCHCGYFEDLLKITSLGWKTSTASTFPQRGHWNSVLCSRLNLDTYHEDLLDGGTALLASIGASSEGLINIKKHML